MEDLFSLPIFFIAFREALETGIIVSVLLAFLKRSLNPEEHGPAYKAMVRQVWLGTISGAVVCILLGAVIIGGAYGLAAEEVAVAEDVWEGVFSLAASLIITVMGAVLLRLTKLQDKWHGKLSTALNSNNSNSNEGPGSWTGRFKHLAEKYALFVLPFITVLREGFEGVLFIAGVGMGLPPSSIPLSVLAGLLIGSLVGILIYKGSKRAPIQYFLVLSTCLLYLVAAGLFSKGVWHLEANEWNKIVGGDAAEVGSGPGSYDIRKSVWHVNCCNPNIDGGGFWGIFNAVLGWQNSATVGSVVSYNVYWIVVAVGFVVMGCRERGHWPFNNAPGIKGVGAREGDQEPLLARSAR